MPAPRRTIEAEEAGGVFVSGRQTHEPRRMTGPANAARRPRRAQAPRRRCWPGLPPLPGARLSSACTARQGRPFGASLRDGCASLDPPRSRCGIRAYQEAGRGAGTYIGRRVALAALCCGAAPLGRLPWLAWLVRAAELRAGRGIVVLAGQVLAGQRASDGLDGALG